MEDKRKRLIAIIVDKYFFDNNFFHTRATFKEEASLPSNNFLVKESKNLRTLDKILDHYNSLKKQKMMIDHEKVILEEQKSRIQMLFQALDYALATYIGGENLPPHGAKSSLAVVPQSTINNKSHPGVPVCVSRPISDSLAASEGKVIHILVALMIDKYLLDNNFSSTRSIFRSEASTLFANFSIHEAPNNNMMTLNQMFNEYHNLKMHMKTMDDEIVMLEREKNRIRVFFQDLHNAVTIYDANGQCPPPAVKSLHTVVPLGVPISMQNKLNTKLNAKSRNIPTSIVSSRKRKDTTTMNAPSAAKKSCSTSSNTKTPTQGQSLWQQFDDAFNNSISVQSSSENCISNINKSTNVLSENSFDASCNQEVTLDEIFSPEFEKEFEILSSKLDL